MNQTKADEIRQRVRSAYSEVAEASDSGGCCGEASSCCGVSDEVQINALISTRLGYTQEELDKVPEGADMGLGCGNPRAIASLKSGEVVLDLGSGGGFDAFLAAQEVGENGRVIGIDMTPAMISRTAMSLLLRVGVTGTFLNLNQAPDVPGDGFLSHQRGDGAP